MNQYEAHPPDWWVKHPAELADALSPQRRPGVAAAGEQRLTLTVEEAAQRLGISRALAYEAVHRGEIPSIKIGRRILVPISQLEGLLHPSG